MARDGLRGFGCSKGVMVMSEFEDSFGDSFGGLERSCSERRGRLYHMDGFRGSQMRLERKSRSELGGSRPTGRGLAGCGDGSNLADSFSSFGPIMMK